MGISAGRLFYLVVIIQKWTGKIMQSENTSAEKQKRKLKIKIYGVGKLCKRSKILELNVRRALKALGAEADIEVIVDFKKMVDTDVRYLPALNVNGKTILQGSVVTVERLKKRLKPFLSAAPATSSIRSN
ncbi:hypothetical protein DRI50_01635 [candidate division KSB1 bacterium]|nr:MAG: hypothetical protein DRI50_01635 [candidate division KSB1 bacterium]